MGRLIHFTVFLCFFHEAYSHHDGDLWPLRVYQHGLLRAFFGGFFSTLTVILGVLVFYHFCIRNGSLRNVFPLFPRKPIIPITVPFARAPNYMDTEQETILLSATSGSPHTVFYSTALPPASLGPHTNPNLDTRRVDPPGYYNVI